MTYDEARKIVDRCGADRAPPIAGKLVHAWKGWCDHEIDTPAIIYTHQEVSRARHVVRLGHDKEF